MPDPKWSTTLDGRSVLDGLRDPYLVHSDPYMEPLHLNTHEWAEYEVLLRQRDSGSSLRGRYRCWPSDPIPQNVELAWQILRRGGTFPGSAELRTGALLVLGWHDDNVLSRREAQNRKARLAVYTQFERPSDVPGYGW